MNRSLYCQCDPDEAAYWERQALLQSIADAVNLANAPPLPPHIAPTVAKKPARVMERYGIVYCQDCGYTLAYCCCDTRPQEAPSKDNRESADLSRRIREAKGGG